MTQPNTFARLVLTTVADSEEAARLGRILVEERLAACVSFLHGARSIYRWQGTLEHSSEVLLLIKTGAGQIEALEARLHKLHSYKTPEFLVLNPESGSPGYLAWLTSSLEQG